VPGAPEQLRLDLVADMARCSTCVQHTRDLAERAGWSIALQAELGEIGERLSALHLVVLVAGGWCPQCGADLTDPDRSPSGTRHCRPCQVGWTLAENEQQVRAVDRHWPAAPDAQP